jgi:hypothetical protein
LLYSDSDAHADTAALEQRIRELESRLEKLDQAERYPINLLQRLPKWKN